MSHEHDTQCYAYFGAQFVLALVFFILQTVIVKDRMYQLHVLRQLFRLSLPDRLKRNAAAAAADDDYMIVSTASTVAAAA